MSTSSPAAEAYANMPSANPTPTATNAVSTNLASKPSSAKPTNCICTWDKCRQWQAVFIQHQDARAGYITIKPGPKKTGKKFLAMLARHLSSKRVAGEPAKLAEKMNQVNSFSVSFLHYTPEQIQLLCSKSKGGRNLKASSTIDFDLAKETCHHHAPDPRDKVEDGKYYISQSVPEADVKSEVQRLQSPRNARTESRSKLRTAAVEAAKTKADVCRERDNAIIDKLRAIDAQDAIIKAKNEEIKALKKKVEQNDKKIAKLQLKIQELKKKRKSLPPTVATNPSPFKKARHYSGNVHPASEGMKTY